MIAGRDWGAEGRRQKGNAWGHFPIFTDALIVPGCVSWDPWMNTGNLTIQIGKINYVHHFSILAFLCVLHLNKSQQDHSTWEIESREKGSSNMCTTYSFLPNWTAKWTKVKPRFLYCPWHLTFFPILSWSGGGRLLSPKTVLTLMLLLSMVSKSSGTILGTWLTRLIKKRPTVLSADTFPDWIPKQRSSKA